MNVVVIGTKSPFSEWPWLIDRSLKLKFSIFCHVQGVVKVLLKLIFMFFCHDHDEVNVVSDGIKIYAFCYHHVVINVAGVMT